MRKWIAVLLLVMAFVTGSAAQVEDLTLALSPAMGTAPQGGTVTFRATVKNLSAQRLYLNQLSLVLRDSEQLNGDSTEFFDQFAGYLEPGAEITSKPLFTVEVEEAAPVGTYAGVVSILGGLNEEAQDNLAQRDFPLEVTRLNPLVAVPDQIPLSVQAGGVVQGQLELINLSRYPQTNLQVAVEGAARNIAVGIKPPATLGGAGTNGAVRQTLPFSVTATDDTSLASTVVLRLTSAEGAEARVTLNVTVVPIRPRPVATPGTLEAGMTRGKESFVECEVANLGAVTATNLKVALPETDWLSLVTPVALGSLAPGAKAKITLSLYPSTTLGLGPYSGAVVVNGGNTSLTIPFVVHCTSDGKGQLKVTSEDEYTYFADLKPPVAAAAVSVKDPLTGAIVAEGWTDEDGEFSKQGLPEGFYQLEVTAPKHGPHRSTIEITAGQEQTVRAFLPREFVTYNWQVEPVNTVDRYEVELEALFETHVPAPVLTVSPLSLDLRALTYDANGKAVVNYTVTNQGLIALDQVKIGFNDHPVYQMQPLVNKLGRLAARTSVVVPVTVTRRAGALQAAAAAIPCSVGGICEACYECGQQLICQDVPLGGRTGDCPGVGPHDAYIPPGDLLHGPYVAAVRRPYGPLFQSRVDCNCSVSIFGPRCAKPKEELTFEAIGSPGPGKYSWYAAEGNPRFGDSSTFKTQFSTAGEKFVEVTYESPAGFCRTVHMVDVTPELEITLRYAYHPGVKENIRSNKQWQEQFDQAAAYLARDDDGDDVLGGGCHDDRCLHVKFDLVPVDWPDAFKGDEYLEPTYWDDGSEPTDTISPLTRAPFAELKIVNRIIVKKGTADQRYSPIGRTERGYKGTLLNRYANAYDALHEWAHSRSVCHREDDFRECEELRRAVMQDSRGGPGYEPVELNKEERDRILNYEPDFFPNAPPNKHVCKLHGSSSATNQSGLSRYAHAQPRRRGRLGAAVGTSHPPENTTPDAHSQQDIQAPSNAGVCARVRIRLNQSVTLTRSAFKATLEVTNSHEVEALENFRVTLSVRDHEDQNATDRFGIAAPVVTGLPDVTGSGSIGPASTASATWTILPTRDAAPTEPTQYFVSGTMSYSHEGMPVTVALFPTPILVKPDPFLALDYFWQRDVYSDDPFTPEIEPAEAFSLGLLVRNQGGGAARNMQITSAQPEIIENEKGLLIGFKLIGSQVNVAPVSPSLKVDLGDIEPGQAAVARWWMTSSLQGQFIDYSAKFKHLDGLGNTGLSLLDSVKIHELEHVVRVETPSDDERPDFLANDVTDAQKLPDRLYQSDGSTSPVSALVGGTTDGAVTDGHLQVKLTLPARPTGWTYLRMEDPSGGRYRLLKVIRADGRELRMEDNAWTTHRTIRLAGQAPFRQHRLCFLDRDPTATYTLVYGQLNPAEESVSGARLQTDGMKVTLTRVPVTAAFADGFYVEAPDRSSGIKVTGKTASEGAVVNVSGTMRTGANGERCIEADSVTPLGAGAVEPLGLGTRSLYGGDFYYERATGKGQRGMAGGAGLNPVGLLLRTLGRVVATSNTALAIDDGDGRSVKVRLPAGVSPPSEGSFVRVTGVLSTVVLEDGLHPVLRPRRAADLDRDLGTGIETFEAPAGLLEAGDNLFSLPGIPADPFPPTVLHRFDPGDGSGLQGRLSRFDAPVQQDVLWDLANGGFRFGNLLCGDGYALKLRADETPQLDFTGFNAAYSDRWISLPRTGYTVIGSPFEVPTDWSDVLVTDGTRTVTLSEAAGSQSPWLEAQARYLDPASRTFKTLGLPGTAADSEQLLPWLAYRVRSLRDNLALILPTQASRLRITRLTPDQATPGGPAFTLRVKGTSFAAGAVIQWNGVPLETSAASASELMALVPANRIAVAGGAVITVVNPGSQEISNPLLFVIAEQQSVNPAPLVTALEPNSILAGSASFNLTITGSDFLPVSTVRWNGAVLPRVSSSETQLVVAVPREFVAQPGSAGIIVENPGPGGGSSDALTFTVLDQGLSNAQPKLTSLSPGSATVGGPGFSLTVSGSEFVRGAMIVWNGTPLGTQYRSASELTADVSTEKITQAGTVQITVLNPAPGGGSSTALPFTITPALHLERLDPASAKPGTRNLKARLFGRGFLPDCKVRWGTSDLKPTSVTAAQLEVVIPTRLLAKAGSVDVGVINPGGEKSNSVAFLVGVPRPQLSARVSSKQRTSTQIQMTIELQNTGSGAAAQVKVTKSTLGAKASVTRPLPAPGSIPVGSKATFTLAYPTTAGASGKQSTLRISGAYQGGKFSSSIPIILP